MDEKSTIALLKGVFESSPSSFSSDARHGFLKVEKTKKSYYFILFDFGLFWWKKQISGKDRSDWNQLKKNVCGGIPSASLVSSSVLLEEVKKRRFSFFSSSKKKDKAGSDSQPSSQHSSPRTSAAPPVPSGSKGPNYDTATPPSNDTNGSNPSSSSVSASSAPSSLNNSSNSIPPLSIGSAVSTSGASSPSSPNSSSSSSSSAPVSPDSGSSFVPPSSSPLSGSPATSPPPTSSSKRFTVRFNLDKSTHDWVFVGETPEDVVAWVTALKDPATAVRINPQSADSSSSSPTSPPRGRSATDTVAVVSPLSSSPLSPKDKDGNKVRASSLSVAANLSSSSSSSSSSSTVAQNGDPSMANPGEENSFDRSAYMAKGGKGNKHHGKETSSNRPPIQGAEHREGYLYVKQQKTKQYWCVLEGGSFKWFISKKDSTPVSELPLMDVAIDTLDNIVFLQEGNRVTDLTCKDSKEAQSWAESLQKGADFATQVDKKTPLFLFRNAPHHPVTARLNLPKGIAQVPCNTMFTAAQVKEALFTRAAELGIMEEDAMFCKPDFYFLRLVGSSTLVLNESQPLAQLPEIKLMISAFITIFFVCTSKMELREKGIDIRNLLNNKAVALNFDPLYEERREQDIAQLLGESVFNSMAGSYSDPLSEINSFRMDLAARRLDWHASIADRLPEYVGSQILMEQVSDQFTIGAHLPGEVVKSLVVDLRTATCEDIRRVMYAAYKKQLGEMVVEDSVDDYVVKAVGYRSYFITDSRRLSEYDYIRAHVNGKKKPELSLVPMNIKQALTREPVSFVDKLLSAQKEISEMVREGEEQPVFATSVTDRISVKIAAMKGVLLMESGEQIFVAGELYHGGKLICEHLETPKIAPPHSILDTVQWTNVNFNFDIRVCDVPMGTRMSFTVISTTRGPIGWVSLQLYNYNRVLVQGSRQLRLWHGGPANPIGTCVENFADKQTIRLYLEFPRFAEGRNVMFKTPSLPPSAPLLPPAPLDSCPPSVLKDVQKDALTTLDKSSLRLIWENRMCLTTLPRALPKVLSAVNWTNSYEVAEAHRILQFWKLKPYEALELFDASFSDPVVREFAVSCLNSLSDGDLNDVLLQLVQVLKYEPFHMSPLTVFLIHRALQQKDLIGFSLFWNLIAEVHVSEISERFLLILEGFLRGCGSIFRSRLLAQVNILEELTKVAGTVAKAPFDDRKAALQKEIGLVRFPDRFSLPLFTDFECCGVTIERCRVMRSKKAPLWLEFKNADRIGPSVTVLYKVGDDLRQDVLTLQMIRLMGKLWATEGLDLHLSPYGVVSTGDERGLVEVVLNSETTAGINRKAGGATQVLVSDVMTKWLREHNPSDEQFAEAQRLFALTCAGYCVATYVLGVGDRHNDNIMITKTGRLFHIDFGHFLGHFKTKFGFKREKAPFVYTHQYEHVLGGKGAPAYNLFVSSAVKAYNILRRNAHLFISLFLMMLSVGLEELQSRSNIAYLRDQLVLDLDDAAAEAHLKEQIDEALNSNRTTLNDVIHILKN